MTIETIAALDHAARVESPASFAARCRAWLGEIIPEIREMPALPATQPGQLILSAQGGELMLFATGYPVAELDDGTEIFGAAEIWIGDGAVGDIAPILALGPGEAP